MCGSIGDWGQGLCPSRSRASGTSRQSKEVKIFGGLEICFGIALAIFYLSGRWDWLRIFPGDGSEIFSQPRIWLVQILMFLALMSYRHPEIVIVPGSFIDHRKRLTKMIVLWVTYQMLSLLWAPYFTESLNKFLDVILIMTMLVALSFVIHNVRGDVLIKYFWLTIAWVGGLLASLAVAQIIAAGPISGMGRVSILGGGPNVFGRNMGLLALTCLHFAKQGKSGKLWGLLAFLACTLVLLSGSRGAMLSLLGGIFIFVFIHRITLQSVLVFSIFGAGFTIAVLHVSGYLDIVKEMYRIRVLELLFDYNGESLYSSGRDILFRNAIELGSMRPIFGNGLDSFAALGFGVYPHNLFLELLVEGGLFGLFLFICVIALTISFVNQYREWIYEQNLVALGFVFIASQFSGDIYNSIGVVIFILLTGVPNTFNVNTSGMKIIK